MEQKNIAYDPALTAFCRIVSEDPLFAADGLDLDAAHAAIAELERSLNVLVEAWRVKPLVRMFFWKYPASETVHPVSFLKEFVTCEARRREFLASPSRESAQGILRQWERAADAYERGTQAYLAALHAVARLERLDPHIKIGYFDAAPTFADFIAWIGGFVENGRELRSDIKRCREVLDGKRATGEAAPQSVPNRIAPDTTVEPRSSASAENPEIAELRRVAQGKFQIEERHGPVLCPVRHFDDGALRQRPFWGFIGRTRHVRVPQLFALLGDDFYFLNLQRGHFLDLVIYRPLIDAGLNYWYQPATSFYVTLDLRYQAEIATAIDFERRTFGRPDLVRRQKASLLDLLIGRGCNWTMRFAELIAIFSYHHRIPPLSFLYVARSYPSLYFLPFNKSVWRLSRTSELTATRFGPTSHYERYASVRKNVSFETVKKVMDISIRRMSYYPTELARLRYDEHHHDE